MPGARHNFTGILIRRFVLMLLPFADIVLAIFVIPTALLLKYIRVAGIRHMPLCKRALFWVGVFPIRNHYYEPKFDHRSPQREFSEDRLLPAIRWNAAEQLSFLERFTYASELLDVPQLRTRDFVFFMQNGFFESGDAEYWYQLLRAVRPRRIFEIGSGHSTLMAIKAIGANQRDDASYRCKHICIEPYEAKWLKETSVEVHRCKVEGVPIAFFKELQENDILFIDSSHVIRPQGDVLFEFLEILPILNKGVIVHVHDIFSPKDYPREWLQGDVRFWNEQYLLEAFLSHNDSWRILGALNFLHHNHYERLKSIAPFLTPDREPGSIYLQRIA